MKTDMGGEMGGRGDDDNPTEVHQIPKMLRKELLYYNGRIYSGVPQGFQKSIPRLKFITPRTQIRSWPNHPYK